MKKIIAIVVVLLCSGCQSLDQLTWDITPEQWLETHWHVQFSFNGQTVILAEPSSSFFVFLLAGVILWQAIAFVKRHHQQKSRLYWGLSMILWSLSTFSAGISYQILSYQLKCANRAICLWTTPWEVGYLLLYVLSANLMIVAVNYASFLKNKRIIYLYALLSSVIYFVIIGIGSVIPQQFFISFELMVLFLVPSYFIMFVMNFIQYRKEKRSIDRTLMIAWVLMLMITVSYFLFLLSPIPTILWEYGIWFNANDVLHILLIGWVWYIYKAIYPILKDSSTTSISS